MSSFVISTPLYNARYVCKVRSYMRVCVRMQNLAGPELRWDPRSHGGALGWSPSSGGKTSRCERRELPNWNVLFHLLFGKQRRGWSLWGNRFRVCAGEGATSSCAPCRIHREALDRYGSRGCADDDYVVESREAREHATFLQLHVKLFIYRKNIRKTIKKRDILN